jgi:hypothetical protein
VHKDPVEPAVPESSGDRAAALGKVPLALQIRYQTGGELRLKVIAHCPTELIAFHSPDVEKQQARLMLGRIYREYIDSKNHMV